MANHHPVPVVDMAPGDTCDHPGLGRLVVLTRPTLNNRLWRLIVNGPKSDVQSYSAVTFDTLRDGGLVCDVEVSCG